MRCIAVDCQKEAMPEDFCCEKHAALIIEFRKAFNGTSIPLHVILNYGFSLQSCVVDVGYINLSKEIILREK